MSKRTGHGTTDRFPTGTDGLPEAALPETLELSDGDELELRIAPVAKRLGEATVRMLAYNGSIPGPTLRVPQGSEIWSTSTTTATSRRPSTGTGCGWTTATTGRTRPSSRSRSAASYSCRVTFPDPGVYWYHPHIREDYGQEMGLYGNVVVVPRRPGLLAAGRTASSP